MRKDHILAILGWTFLSVVVMSAAPPKGALSGIVVNSKGRPVKAAQVFFQAADGTNPHILHSNADGRFRVSPIRDGYYELRAESGGAWSEWEHNVMVRNGAEVNVTLRLVRTSPPTTSGQKPRGGTHQ